MGVAPAGQSQAGEYVAAVRVHADRVHDLVRRAGCEPAVAALVVERTALDLLAALTGEPDAVPDLVGWWFGRASEVATRLAPRPVGGSGPERRVQPHGDPGSLLAGTSGEAQVRAALAELAEHERTAVLLRDAYDLPPGAVAVALGLSPAEAAGLVAAGRLHFIAHYDGRHVQPLPAHSGSADLAELSRLADGTLPVGEAVLLRRHVRGCPGCEDVCETALKARRVVAGLPVLAMPDPARDHLLELVAREADARVPALDELLRAAPAGRTSTPLVAPGLAVSVITAALVLGVLAGVVSRWQPVSQPATAASGGASPAASPAQSSRQAGSPPQSPPSRPPSSPPASSDPPPAGGASIRLSPAAGPNGRDITVIGVGWRAGQPVAISYRSSVGTTGASATAVPDAAGRFVAELAAEDPANVPGPHQVLATDGRHIAVASYQPTS